MIIQVLSIGNSFTYFNDMLYAFLNMSKTVDPKSRVESIAYGGYYPSSTGSYLAACVIFRTITEKSTIGLPCPSNVSLYNLSVVQKITDSTI